MKKTILIAALSALIGMGCSSPLTAQQVPHTAQKAPPQVQAAPPCVPHQSVVDQLKDDYGEGQAAIGLANNGFVLQLYSTKSGSSWTIFVTRPDGKSCLMIAGEHLELIEKLDEIKGIKIVFPTKK